MIKEIQITQILIFYCLLDILHLNDFSVSWLVGLLLCIRWLGMKVKAYAI